jgi:hypothetical protein
MAVLVLACIFPFTATAFVLSTEIFKLKLIHLLYLQRSPGHPRIRLYLGLRPLLKIF